MTNATNNPKMARVPEHAQLEALVTHIGNVGVDTEQMQKNAEALAKRAGLDMDLEYGDFYSQALLFEARSLIAKQYNIDIETIDVCIGPFSNGGYLQIGTETIEHIEGFDYWRSGCAQ
ncbi:MAG: hypothetical protein VX408_06290 [Pseudomonadota bacterium]|nr:hypothetical protein [Pseudomonadota bacterium]MED6317134.1 hypothetical protein [Pseudomonadota bacterium]